MHAALQGNKRLRPGWGIAEVPSLTRLIHQGLAAALWFKWRRGLGLIPLLQVRAAGGFAEDLHLGYLRVVRRRTIERLSRRINKVRPCLAAPPTRNHLRLQGNRWNPLFSLSAASQRKVVSVPRTFLTSKAFHTHTHTHTHTLFSLSNSEVTQTTGDYINC